MELSRQDEWQGHELGGTAAILGKDDGGLKQVTSMETVSFQGEWEEDKGYIRDSDVAPASD